MSTTSAARKARPNGHSPGEVAILELLQGGLSDPTTITDPSANVFRYVDLHVKRLDDLRFAAQLRQDDLRLASDRREDDLRAESTFWRNRMDDYRDRTHEEMLRVRFSAQGDLAQAESKRIDAQMVAEARRIDALLAAAANAVTLASTRAELTATALAERVDTSAKTLAGSVEASAGSLRLQVQTTNDAIAGQIAILRAESGNRLTTLEQTRYGQMGHEAQRVEAATTSRWEDRQRSQRSEWATGLVIIGGIALGGLALGVANFVSPHVK